jgi:hypothetical protein
MWEVEIGGLRFKTNPGKSQQVPISKTNWRDWRYASSNRTLLCKFKALSHTSVPPKKKKKQAWWCMPVNPATWEGR